MKASSQNQSHSISQLLPCASTDAVADNIPTTSWVSDGVLNVFVSPGTAGRNDAFGAHFRGPGYPLPGQREPALYQGELGSI